MDKERKSLTLAEMHGLDVKKVMDSIDHLDTLVYRCDKGSILEMFNTKNSLDILIDKGLIGPPASVIANKRLKDIGEKFKSRCSCAR